MITLIRRGSYGLASIDRIDVPTLLLRFPYPNPLRSSRANRFGLLLYLDAAGALRATGEKGIGAASRWGVGELWQNQFMKTRFC
jgi:hypothetical protein